MGSSDSTPTVGPINTGNDGRDIGEVGLNLLMNMYQKAPNAMLASEAAQECANASALGLPCKIVTVGAITTAVTSPTVVATPTTGTVVTKVNDLVKPMSNPCTSNLTNTMLTMKDVQEEYTGMKWGNSEPWTPEAMQCWAWLSTQSGELHPDRIFAKQYGYEPYLILMV